MKYLTTHFLTLPNSTEEVEMDLIDQLRTESIEFKHAITNTPNVPNYAIEGDYIESDLKAFSKKHEGVLFRLECHGDDKEDRYVVYYRSGLRQHCKLIKVYEEFDESKLK